MLINSSHCVSAFRLLHIAIECCKQCELIRIVWVGTICGLSTFTNLHVIWICSKPIRKAPHTHVRKSVATYNRSLSKGLSHKLLNEVMPIVIEYVRTGEISDFRHVQDESSFSDPYCSQTIGHRGY